MKTQAHLFLTNEHKFVGEVITSARIARGLSRSELALKANISDVVLEKLEKGTGAPSIHDWTEIAHALKISLDTIQLGFLDETQEASLRSNSDEHGFLVEGEFRENRCLKIRELLPYFAAAIDVEGWRSFVGWLGQMGLSAAFIYNLDNQVNLRFYEQLVSHLYGLGVTDVKADIIADYGVTKFFHGRLWGTYCESQSPYERLKTYVKSAPFYQCAFEISCIDEHSTRDSQLAIECRPAPFLFPNLGDYDPEALSFLDIVRENVFLKIANTPKVFGDHKHNREHWKIEEIQSIYQGHNSSIYIMTQNA